MNKENFRAEKLKRLAKAKSEIEDVKFLFKGTTVSETERTRSGLRVEFEIIDDDGVKAIMKICGNNDLMFYIDSDGIRIF